MTFLFCRFSLNRINFINLTVRSFSTENENSFEEYSKMVKNLISLFCIHC